MVDFAARYVTVDDPFGAYDLLVSQVASLLDTAEHTGIADGVEMPLDNWSFDQLRYHFVETVEKYGAVAEGAAESDEGAPIADDPPVFQHVLMS